MTVRGVVLVSLFLVSTALAQVTTGELRGTVKAADDGSPMAEATVTLTHVPSGNEKTTTTNSDGGFAFTGLRVGGPYTVTAQLSGFKKIALANQLVRIGDVTKVDIMLETGGVTEVIQVTAETPLLSIGSSVMTS